MIFGTNNRSALCCSSLSTVEPNLAKVFAVFPQRDSGGSVAGLRHSRAWIQIAVATLSGNSLRQTVHTHCASVQQEAKLVAALLRVARVTAGLAESNGSLPPGL